MSRKGSIYDEHRHIIHNQMLILVLAILANVAYFPVIPIVLFWLYGSFPEIFVPAVIIFECVGGCFIAWLDYRVAFKKWRERRGYEDETDHNQKSRRKEEKHARDTISF